MSNNIDDLISACSKTSSFLYRDFKELSGLQSSSRGNAYFIDRSLTKARENLSYAFGKYYHSVIFDESEANKNRSDNVVFIELLDGKTNFARTIPIFGSMASVVTPKGNAESSIMYFPVIGSTYYAKNGKGAFFEGDHNSGGGSIRTRVSGINNFDSAVVSSYDLISLKKIMPNSTALDDHNLRKFGSNLYDLAMLVSGKMDLIDVNISSLARPGYELFIREAGGKVIVSSDERFIASNFSLV